MSKSLAARFVWPSQLTIAARARRLVGVVCAGLALAPAISPGAAIAAGTLDQKQENFNNATTINMQNELTSAAQTFTAGLSGRLDQVELHLARGSGSGPLFVEIRNVASGAPGSTVLASASISEASVPFVFAFVTVPFASPATVAAGTQYAIVAYVADASSPEYHWGLDDTGPYAAGSFFISSPGSTWNPVRGDLAFRTYVSNSPPVCSAVRATPGVLKADNKMQTVTLAGATDPDGDPVTFAINAVTQDEPTSGGWKQDTKTPDAASQSANAVSLRGEQNPSLNGRVYRIAFTVTDTAGANCSDVAKVGVAQNKKGAVAFDDGNQASWNSFTGALVP